MDIKITDVFGSEGIKNLHLRSALVLTGPEAEAAAWAIQSHDSLVKENKGLIDELKNAAFVHEKFNQDIVDGYITRDKQFAVDLLSGSASLLLELKN